MREFLFATLFIFSFSSCIDSTKTKKLVLNDQQDGATFVPDSFANRDDTLSFNIDKGNLVGTLATLDVSYSAVACTCAQWSITKESDKPGKRIELYLEPGNPSLIIADTLFNGNNLPIRLSVSGRFYLKEGYPKNYRPAKGGPNPARVFQYTKIKIISKGSS